MTEPIRLVDVPFLAPAEPGQGDPTRAGETRAGKTAGEETGGELSWGQREIWQQMVAQRSSLSIGRIRRLEPGTSVADVAADLGYLMGAHPSLRTRLELSAGQEPRQRVALAGTIRLAVLDAGDTDPARVADELCAEYVATDFDYAAEWPLRWAVITRRSVPVWLVSVACHLAADGLGLQAMWAGLARWQAAGRPAGASPASPGTPPLEQVRQQAGPSGQRHNAAALRHWEKLLRAAPARAWAPPADVPPDPGQRYWQLCYESPASQLAVQAIALRTAATTSTVLLAVYAAGLARMTGLSPAMVQVTASNRFRPGLADSVATVMQASLCAIDVAGARFDEVVARAWRGAVNAYKFAYYDPAARDELIARISAERGQELNISATVNDRRITFATEPDGPPATTAELQEALGRSRIVPGFRRERPAGPFLLLIDDAPDVVFYELVADTREVSPARMEAFLRDLEEIAVTAALDPAAVIAVPVTTGQSGASEMAPA